MNLFELRRNLRTVMPTVPTLDTTILAVAYFSAPEEV